MARETKDAKALRLIAEHRVKVHEVTLLGCVAEVAGDGDDYVVKLDGRWQCTCANGCCYKGLCSHATAVSTIYRAVLPALQRRT